MKSVFGMMHWAPTDMPIINYVQHPLQSYESKHVVANYVNSAGAWDIQRQSNILLENIITSILDEFEVCI
jgi:hypothetical protein